MTSDTSAKGLQYSDASRTAFSHEIVDSPDDGGYWISQFDPIRERSRASKKIYVTRAEAERALYANKVRWEPWS